MDDRDEDSPIKSVRKAVDVLDALASARRPLRVMELATKLRMSQSAVSRIIATLAKTELVYQDDETGRCHLGLGLAVLGAKSLGRRNLDRIALPVMDEIAARTGFYVGLGRLSRGQVVVMRALPAPLAQSDVTLTVVAPLHACAPGKILASGMHRDAIVDLLSAHGMDPITPNTITDPDRFLESVEATRRNGFALDDQEAGHDYVHFAVPILDHHGAVIASMSAGGTLSQIGDSDLPTLLQTLNHGALRVSRQLDYDGEIPLDTGALPAFAAAPG
ncbi:IclR family transcriptional regulator [Sphingobium sp.]|uniref:IclR family transcriptional regulator n=1 Tax=Sphingobium sp. TaxID=1912891 RepID=UPI003B3A6338